MRAMATGSEVIGLDATHNVTCHRNMYLFAIMGRCSSGAIPIAYFISTQKDEEAIFKGLTIFQIQITQVLRKFNCIDGQTDFEPAAICIDMDVASNNAIRRVFPRSTVVLCHYHFMVNMINQARASKHGIASAKVPALMSSIRQLASARSVEDFTLFLTNIKSASPSTYEYLETYYLCEAWVDTFTEVNRTSLPLSTQWLCRSNMLTEVSFRTLKYIVLSGYMNKRLDILLYSIAYKLIPYFLCRTNTTTPPSPRFLISLDARQKGTQMYR